MYKKSHCWVPSLDQEPCAEFLHIVLAESDSNKIYSKSTLAQRIVSILFALLPSNCSHCNEDYCVVFEISVPPVLTSNKCFQGCHNCGTLKATYAPLVDIQLPTWLVERVWLHSSKYKGGASAANVPRDQDWPHKQTLEPNSTEPATLAGCRWPKKPPSCISTCIRGPTGQPVCYSSWKDGPPPWTTRGQSKEPRELKNTRVPIRSLLLAVERPPRASFFSRWGDAKSFSPTWLSGRI